ncbi:uncharacterized protein LOC108330334 [Vigna angularis]|uniref:uncharacterized protein LOC108330334 n=1 Tax=Phaseolus angularis TaxID=3914 RepID=UPI000809A540|nr:uncharacterized protein LOC108330334 [Vigna angularis]
MRMLLQGSDTPITWDLFKKKFYTEYFLDSVRFAKEIEFLQLVQGNMKFQNALRGDVKLLVMALCIKEFPASVERARVLEKTKEEMKKQSFRRCSLCGKDGHFERDCSIDVRSGLRPVQSQQRGGDRPQTIGRVYAMSGAKEAGSCSLIISSCVFLGRVCCVLFDSGATHSFVSEACMQELGLLVKELQYDLVVFTSAYGLVKTFSMWMDWLSVNHILIDYGKKKLLFSEVAESELLSTGQRKCLDYLLREVEFSIDLVPGA